MKLYDIRCRECGKVEKDVIATRAKRAEKWCTCGGRMRWAPSFGYADAREPWYCVQTDQTFSSYRQLEKWCERNGKIVISQSDYDRNVRGKGIDYEKIVAKNDPARREAVAKAAYQLRHGIRNSPVPGVKWRE